jgi:uncharacterized membrane-anchored protein
MKEEKTRKAKKVMYDNGLHRRKIIKGDTVTINFNITLDIDDSILEEIDKLEDIKPN